MRTLIVGVGALGGILATRLAGAGRPAALATRDGPSAERIREAGLRVTGIGGEARADAPVVGPLESYEGQEPFDLVVLATKAGAALETAPRLVGLLREGGTLLPIQNGAVSEVLAARLGGEVVLGGLSNLAGTLEAPGRFRQTNAGHLLMGEVGGGESDRAHRVAAWLGAGVEVRETANLRGALWSKLLLNCSVTTLGAVAGMVMREYMGLPAGRELFRRSYQEALSVALAAGARPERMIVEPIPPDPDTGGDEGMSPYGRWVDEIMAAYGDLKPSMLQDFERGRVTEIDVINGYIVDTGRLFDIPTAVNEQIVRAVRRIKAGERAPSPGLLEEVLWEAKEDRTG